MKEKIINELTAFANTLDFVCRFKDVQTYVHQIAKDKGWWDDPKDISAFIANTHAELSEAWEWIRKDNPASDHIPEFSGVEEEMADVIIRIMDTAEKEGFRIAEAIIAKMKYNTGRSYRHGGKKF